MPKACELSKGDIVAIDGTPCSLEELKVSTPSARGAASVYHLRFRNLVTKAKLDHNVKGEEMYGEIDFEKRLVQYLYKEQDEYVFMDTEDYSQFSLLEIDIADQIPFLKEDMEEITALMSEGKVLAIELPPAVELRVVSCDPSMRAASATARTKNAVLETGLELQVPDYLEADEIIRVDTRTGKYMSRA
ncbi:MAG: elongation factor P [Kiritimatiellae bacterium]|nr:elongation factor P [Kiritimatiellia bacterium]